jgi:hypothetical protein
MLGKPHNLFRRVEEDNKNKSHNAHTHTIDMIMVMAYVCVNTLLCRSHKREWLLLLLLRRKIKENKKTGSRKREKESTREITTPAGLVPTASTDIYHPSNPPRPPQIFFVAGAIRDIFIDFDLIRSIVSR